ncbi:MAG TPA: dipeptidase [Terriglobales bacterium]|nr:dipeptidase [Terriglobales bacterium]
MNSIKTWLAGIAGLLAIASSLLAQNVQVSPKAKEIHDSAIVIDTHADTPQRFLDENFDIGSVTPTTEGNIDLQKAREGNLGAEFFSIWVAPDIYKGHFAKRTLDLIDSVYEQAARHPDQMMMAFSAEDIVEARSGQHKKLAALMGIEGGHSIEGDIRLLRDYYRLGVRYMTLTWSNTNEIGDSSGDLDKKDVKHHKGLTPFGKQVVLEMNRLGMMVDISHVADKTFWDTLAVTKAPVIASHSSARALSHAPRNMTDEMLRAVAKNGGVVDVNFYSGFVDEKFRLAEEAQKPAQDAAVAAALRARREKGLPVDYMDEEKIQREWMAKIPRPPLSALIDQIDHVAKVAGIDHVGLGSDFDGVSGALPAGMDSVADLPKITQGLLDRGYTQEQIEKILGGNVLRVFREVERVSRQMRGQP